MKIVICYILLIQALILKNVLMTSELNINATINSEISPDNPLTRKKSELVCHYATNPNLQPQGNQPSQKKRLTHTNDEKLLFENAPQLERTYFPSLTIKKPLPQKNEPSTSQALDLSINKASSLQSTSTPPGSSPDDLEPPKTSSPMKRPVSVLRNETTSPPQPELHTSHTTSELFNIPQPILPPFLQSNPPAQALSDGYFLSSRSQGQLLDQSGGYLKTPGYENTIIASVNTSSSGTASAPSCSEESASTSFETCPENNRAELESTRILNPRRAVKKDAPKEVFLSSNILGNFDRPVELRRTHIKGGCKNKSPCSHSFEITNSKPIYRVFLIFNDLKQHPIPLESIDAGPSHSFRKTKFKRPWEDDPGFIRDLKMHLFVYKETPGFEKFARSICFYKLNNEFYQEASQRFLEHKTTPNPSRVNNPWTAFLEDCKHEKIGNFEISKVLDGIGLVSYFKLSYSGTLKGMLNKEKGLFGCLDIDYRTVDVKILNKFGSNNLKKIEVKIKGAKICQGSSQNPGFKAHLTASSFFVFVDLE